MAQRTDDSVLFLVWTIVVGKAIVTILQTVAPNLSLVLTMCCEVSVTELLTSFPFNLLAGSCIAVLLL